jgi:hypothetical protein
MGPVSVFFKYRILPTTVFGPGGLDDCYCKRISSATDILSEHHITMKVAIHHDHDTSYNP